MLSAQSSVAISPHRPPIAALFDLDDPAERFMIETMQRFHCEHPGLYVAHAMKRIRDAQRERVVPWSGAHAAGGVTPALWAPLLDAELKLGRLADVAGDVPRPGGQVQVSLTTRF